jgi:hypothetical protein
MLWSTFNHGSARVVVYWMSRCSLPLCIYSVVLWGYPTWWFSAISVRLLVDPTTVFYRLQRSLSTIMGISSSTAILCLIFTALVSSSPPRHSRIRIVYGDDSPPVVDLGYAMYQGSTDPSTNISSFLGIRYAAPPIGEQILVTTFILN